MSFLKLCLDYVIEIVLNNNDKKVTSSFPHFVHMAFSSNYVYIINGETNGKCRTAQNDDIKNEICVRMF